MKLTNLNINTKKILAIFIFVNTLFLSACGESVDSQDTRSPEAFIQQGQAYLDMHQYKAAFSAAHDAIKSDRALLDGYLLLAEIHQQSGQPQQAVKSLERYTGVKNSDYYFSLINVYQKSGKLISAERLIDQQSSVLSEDAARFEFVKAQQLLFSKKLKQAQTKFQALLQNADYKADAMLALANIDALLGEIDKAIATLNEIIEADPKNTDALFLKSMIYAQAGELAKAEEYLSQALTTLPSADVFTSQRIQIIESLANVLTQQGRSAEAMVYSRILSDEFPGAKSLSLQYASALELFEKKEFVAAKKILQDILNTYPADRKSATLLSLILYNEGDVEKAEELLSNIVDPETSPSKLTEFYITTQLQQNKSSNVMYLLDHLPEEKRNLDTWALYAGAAIQEKEFTKAKMALDKAKSLSSTSVKVAILENLYYNSIPDAQPEKALSIIKQALVEHPTEVKLHIKYIKQLLILDRKKDADDYAIHLKNDFSRNNEIQLIVAKYYITENKLDQARAILDNILLLEVDNFQALYGIAKINELQQFWQMNLAHYKNIISYYPVDIHAYRDLVFTLMHLQMDPLKANSYVPNNYQPSLLALTQAELTLRQNKIDLAKNFIQQAGIDLPQKYQPKLAKLTLQLHLAEAQAAFINHDYKAARAIVIQTLVQAPTDIRLLNLLTRTEIRTEQYDEAEKIIKKIANEFPENALATQLQAEVYLAQKDNKKATDLLTAYWQKNNDERVANQLYQQLQKDAPGKAAIFLNQWQDKSPTSLTAIRYKALDLQQQGKAIEALELYEVIIKEAPNNIISLNNAAWLYFEQGNPRALTLAERAYALMPRNPAIMDTYGWILFNTNDKKMGKKLIEQASQLLPDEASIKEHLLAVNAK